MNCHKCPYNGKKDNHCLSCTLDETYSYKYQNYLIEGYEPIQPDNSGSEQVLEDKTDDIEDMLRKVIYTILDLKPNELLFLKAIHDGKTLTEFGKEMEVLAQKNLSFSRHRAYQTRNAIAKRLPNLIPALLTKGQWKEQRKFD